MDIWVKLPGEGEWILSCLLTLVMKVYIQNVTSKYALTRVSWIIFSLRTLSCFVFLHLKVTLSLRRPVTLSFTICSRKMNSLHFYIYLYKHKKCSNVKWSVFIVGEVATEAWGGKGKMKILRSVFPLSSNEIKYYFQCWPKRSWCHSFYKKVFCILFCIFFGKLQC